MGHNEDQHKYNLFYGWKENELKHISEVENGLKCGCKCAACNEKLVARNGGTKRVHHFAHYISAECKYGVQTSIHIAAKNILEKAKKIKIPGTSTFVYTEVEKVDDGFISHGEFHQVSEETYIPIESVVLEKKLYKYIPDVVIIYKGKKLVVEIAVTHFVGRKKLEKIRSAGISALEIDLSKIENDFRMEELEPLIIENLENKLWLYNKYSEKKMNEIQINTKKRIELKIKKEQKEKREIWYRNHYKPIVYRLIDAGYIVKQIENCPLKKREHNGQHYASVKVDCVDCSHFRREREEGKFIVCLYDYHKWIDEKRLKREKLTKMNKDIND